LDRTAEGPQKSRKKGLEFKGLGWEVLKKFLENGPNQVKVVNGVFDKIGMEEVVDRADDVEMARGVEDAK
jgi:hypothetical protein